MDAGEVAISLLKAPTDPPLFSAESETAFQDVLSAFRKEGIRADALIMRMDSVDAAGGFVGEFLVPFIQATAAPVGVIVAAWLHGKLGRKVRIQFGDTKAEAEAVEDVARLLELAAQHHEQFQKAKCK